MYTEIIDLIRKCGHRRVAFAVGTLTISTLALSAGLASRAWAADEEAISRLIRDNACVGCDLHEADLRRLDLSSADLSGADLEGANLYYANLDGAQLAGANLIDVNLGYASAQGANFDGADLRYAILDRTNLTRASMVNVDLRESYIKASNFTDAVLDGADMRDTLFYDADFSVTASICGALTWTGTEHRRGCEVAVPTEINDEF